MWYISGVMAAPGALQACLNQSLEAAEAEWPALRLDRASFEQRLRRLLEDHEGDPCDALAKLRAGDLYLAHGCALSVPAAVDAFTAKHLVGLEEHLQRFKTAGVSADDVRRELEDTLLLGRGGSGPRIAQYNGGGTLRRFVAVAARNAALTLLRRRVHEATIDVDDVASQLVSQPDSGTRIASRHVGAIRDAVRASLDTLDRRQRMIVRLHLSQGVSLTQIARMLKVHQSTVSRALETALQHLYDGICRTLREVHGLEGTELDSIVRDVRSNLDLSLSRVLRDAGEV
jgi:RNA polymerase sigma-70 factor (ECF subfamily)